MYDKILQDVASGLNFKRKGLTSILDQVEEGGVEKIVVSYRDRLARFGIDLLEGTFKKHGTILDVVSSQQTDHQGTQEELGQDLLALCNYFVAKNNGRREPLPMLEVDAKGTSLKIPKLESESDRKKVTKELGSGVATKKIKLHPRTQEDRQWLRKMFGIAGWNYNQAVKMIQDPKNERRAR